MEKKFEMLPLSAADGAGIVAAIEKAETDHQNAIEAVQEGM
jgi:hypothetical protein